MATFYPVYVTIALFIALMLFDIIDRSPEKIRGHALGGLVVLFPVVYLSFNDMELVSWGLLAVPVIILTICYFLGSSPSSAIEMITAAVSQPTPVGQHTPTSKPVAATSAPVCATGAPLLSTPAGPKMSSASDPHPNTYTPITACNMA